MHHFLALHFLKFIQTFRDRFWGLSLFLAGTWIFACHAKIGFLIINDK